MLEARVAGIPCLVDVHYVSIVQGSFRYDAPSDLDYLGYTELDYTICDRRGRPAPWLERKATTQDISDIETLIIREAENEDDF
ncbi:MAG: hypothetical protein ACR2IJ_02185 [Fluviibacter sp.]